MASADPPPGIIIRAHEQHLFDVAASRISRVSFLVHVILHHRDWLATRIVFDRFLTVAGLDRYDRIFFGLVVVNR